MKQPSYTLPSLAIGLGLGLLLPALLAREPSPPGERPGRVYLIRGQGYVFSGGWRALRDRLRAEGVRAEDISDLSGGWPAEDVLADHQAGRLTGPIVFVGHSRGARQSLLAAKRLGRKGITVDLIVTADVAAPSPVPANVRRAVNLYLTQNRLYPAGPLRPASGSRAIIENVALDLDDSPIDSDGLHHLNITDRPEVQDYLFRRIMAVLDQPQRSASNARRHWE
jgi:hypothetical protein